MRALALSAATLLMGACSFIVSIDSSRIESDADNGGSAAGGAAAAGGSRAGGSAGASGETGAAGAGGEAGSAGVGGSAVVPPPGCEGAITFAEPEFEEAVRRALGIPTGEILYEDVLSVLYTSRKDGCYRHSGGRQIASLRGTHPEPITRVHPQTAESMGIADGDLVYVETTQGRIKQRAVLSDDTDPRVVVVDYAWWFPEESIAELYGWEKSNINILTGDKPPFNREMGSVNLRGALCKIYKA